jgi:hypothetical protein
MVIFHSFLYVYQRVLGGTGWWPWFSKSPWLVGCPIPMGSPSGWRPHRSRNWNHRRPCDASRAMSIWRCVCIIYVYMYMYIYIVCICPISCYIYNMWSICGWCCMVEIYGKYCMTVCGKYVYIYNYMGNVYGMSWIYADYVSKWLLGGCFWKYEHHWWIFSYVRILRVIHVPISWNTWSTHQQTTNLPIIQTNMFDSFTFFILLRKEKHICWVSSSHIWI